MFTGVQEAGIVNLVLENNEIRLRKRNSKPHHPRQHLIQQHSTSQSVHIGSHSQAKPNQNETTL